MPRFARLACVSALAFVPATAGPVSAQEPQSTLIPCMRAQELARFLEENFGELPTARGLGDGGVVVTMFAAGDSNTWTLAITQPSGVSCILAAGESFEHLPASVALPAGLIPS